MKDKDNIEQLENAPWLELGEDEKILAGSNQSIWPHITQLLTGVIVAIFGFYIIIASLTTHSLAIGAIMILVGSAIFIVDYLRYVTTFYVFTNKGIVKKTQILSHRTVKISYDKIDDYEVLQPLTGRILGYGHIEYKTASPRSKTSDKDYDLRMGYIPDENKAVQIIRNNI